MKTEKEIIELAEHSFDKTTLYSSSHENTPIVLDAGCRGFEFRDQLRTLGAKVISIDCDNLDDPSNGYWRYALTDNDGWTYLHRSGDSQATRVSKVLTDERVSCVTLKTLMHRNGIRFFDLIKLDIEGSEYEVIMSLEEPPTKQFSIEFHLHTGIYGMHEMDLMTNKLKALGYETIQHELSRRHGCSENYWDSLFILK